MKTQRDYILHMLDRGICSLQSDFNCPHCGKKTNACVSWLYGQLEWYFSKRGDKILEVKAVQLNALLNKIRYCREEMDEEILGEAEKIIQDILEEQDNGF